MTHFEAYEDMAGKWRWRMVAENHLCRELGRDVPLPARRDQGGEDDQRERRQVVCSVVPGVSVKAVLRRLIQREDARRSRLSLGEA